MKKICPNCKGKNIARLVWGLPCDEFLEEIGKEENKGKYRLRSSSKQDSLSKTKREIAHMVDITKLISRQRKKELVNLHE
ncbi:MAG: hypothetical protein O3C48_08330 [Crenarchaeota archaeon]|nr:hypothetical protein [Thermoproteota archaeon]